MSDPFLTDLANLAEQTVRQLILGDLSLRQASLDALLTSASHGEFPTLHVARQLRADLAASIVRQTERRVLLFFGRRETYQPGQIALRIAIEPADPATKRAVTGPPPSESAGPRVILPKAIRGRADETLLATPDGRRLAIRVRDDDGLFRGRRRLLEGRFAGRGRGEWRQTRDWDDDWVVSALLMLRDWAADAKRASAEDDGTGASVPMARLPGVDDLVAALAEAYGRCSRLVAPDPEGEQDEIARLNVSLRRWGPDLGAGYEVTQLVAAVTASFDRSGRLAAAEKDTTLRLALDMIRHPASAGPVVVPRPPDTFVRGDYRHEELTAILRASRPQVLADLGDDFDERHAVAWNAIFDDAGLVAKSVWVQLESGEAGSDKPGQRYLALFHWFEAPRAPAARGGGMWIGVEVVVDLARRSIGKARDGGDARPRLVFAQLPGRAGQDDRVDGDARDRVYDWIADALASLVHWGRSFPTSH